MSKNSIGGPLSATDFNNSGGFTYLSVANEDKLSYLVNLKAFNIEGDTKRHLTVTQETLGGLIDFAQKKLDAMPDDQQKTIASDPHDSHLRRPDFILSCAQEYCEQAEKPFIMHTVRSSMTSDAYPAIRDMGIPGDNGYQTQRDYKAPISPVMDAIKSWLKIERKDAQNAKDSLLEHGTKAPGSDHSLEKQMASTLAENKLFSDLESETPQTGPSHS